jgi:demethylmenaquinone methyltransferase / 2-methoxy-6-polyprenyl-1,4-benzoquinol methylase
MLCGLYYKQIIMINKTTNFGFKEVPEEEKASLVKDVFDSVSKRYDLMNDVMSLGLHRLWKRFAIDLAQVKKSSTVLDLASGSGDLARSLARQVGPKGKVYASDINFSMLKEGIAKSLDTGLYENIHYVLADAENLPFKSSTFDCVMISFGLRNVTRKEEALKSIYRVLKPGGKLVILEFSHPSSSAVKKIYDRYSFDILPALGDLIAQDRESYQYLAESIRKHPDQERLKIMMEDSGYKICNFYNLTFGIVAAHVGYKI